MSANSNVDVLFSDLDGTLVHYPKDFNEYARLVSEDDSTSSAVVEYTTGQRCECVVLTSMTGGKAYMSRRTVTLIEKLRLLGVDFVIITGARTSTYITRQPLLPDADYEFFENGGRMLANGKLSPEWSDSFVDLVGPIKDRVNLMPEGLPVAEQREGKLWAAYKKLVLDGWYVDARDYTVNFRVDLKKSNGKTEEEWQKFVREEVIPAGLASSFNLGKADVYPAGSGKANAAAHVLELKGLSAENAVAMFDDDNDLELGALVGKSFLPGVTHPSVLAAMKRHGERWTLTKARGFLGTEEALESIITLRQGAMQRVPGLGAKEMATV